MDAIVLHKPKRRSVLENRTSQYRDFIETLDPRYYISLPPEVSPSRLILNSDCTIAMPITTPSLIANYLGKDSMYFDPLKKIRKYDPALRNVPLINDAMELKNILSDMKKERIGKI